MRGRLIPGNFPAARVRAPVGLTSILDQAAMTLFADEGVTTGAMNAVTSWQSGGYAPSLFLGSGAITLDAGIVKTDSTLSGFLYFDPPEPVDLPVGFSVFACCRTPDVTSLGTSKRLMQITGDGGTPFNALFPNTASQVLMATNGGNVAASGIAEADLESFAVWGFVNDLATGQGRILRNGITLASGAVTGSLTGITRYWALFNASIELKGAIMFAGGSAEIDVAATAFLTEKYGVL